MLRRSKAGAHGAEPERAAPSMTGQIPEQIDANAARELLQRLDHLSDSERDRLLERMLLET